MEMFCSWIVPLCVTERPLVVDVSSVNSADPLYFWSLQLTVPVSTSLAWNPCPYLKIIKP